MIQVAASTDPHGFAAALEAEGAELVPFATSGVVIALDQRAFDGSVGATRIAFFPSFEIDWDPSGADAVFVAHDELLSEVQVSVDVRVVGALPPHGIIAAPGVEASEANEKGSPVVLVDGSWAADQGLKSMVLQWQLAAPARYLVDVGSDPALARNARAALSGQGVQVGLVGPGAILQAWAMASLALGPGLANHALAAEVGIVLMDGTTACGRALAASGVAAIAGSLSTLSLTLDAALEAADDLSQAARDQGAATTAERVLEAAEQVDTPSESSGEIEWLPVDEVPFAHARLEQAPKKAGSDGTGDAAIERELAALKASLED